MTQKHKVAWVERKNDDWFLLSLESGEKVKFQKVDFLDFGMAVASLGSKA